MSANKLAFRVDRALPGTLTGQVVRELRRRIADGSLRPDGLHAERRD